MRDHFIKELTILAEANPNIILITGDLGFGVLTDFEKRFPNQYINAGVAEQNMTGIATGLALSNKIVFTYSIGNFNTLRCLEQIRNDACYHDAHVNIISVGGGFSYGQLGFSHHATEDLAIMRALPNLRVFSPADFWETEEITKQMVQLKGVNYLRLDKSSAGRTETLAEVFEVGKARIIREGNDFTLIGTGGIIEEAIKAANELAVEGINCQVISMPTIKPFDTETVIKAAKDTQGIITIEEHTIDGGLGGAVAEVLMESGIYPKYFYRIGLRSVFSTTVGDQNFLRKKYSMDKDSIIFKVKEFLNK